MRLLPSFITNLLVAFTITLITISIHITLIILIIIIIILIYISYLLGSDLSSLKQIMKVGDTQKLFLPFQNNSHISNTKIHTMTLKNEKKKMNIKIDKINNNNKKRNSANKIDNNDNDNAEELNSNEMELLKQFINPIYLTSSSMIDINQQFCENSSLQLNDFIREDIMMMISRHLILADEDDHIGNDLGAVECI